MLTSLARRAAPLLVVAGLALALPSVAAATTLAVDFPGPEIVEGLPAPLHVAASAEPSLLFTRVVAKPLTPEANCSRGPVFDFSRRLLDMTDDVVDVTTAVVFPRPGPWLVCAWAGTAPARYAEQSVHVVVRPPHATVSVRAPRRVRGGGSARIVVEYAVEARRRLLVGAVRGSRCGRGADAARALGARVRALAGPIAGSALRSVAVPLPAPGRWRVCAYVQRDAGPGVANAVAGADVSIGTPDRRARGEFGR
jgi:hypothetical protein